MKSSLVTSLIVFVTLGAVICSNLGQLHYYEWHQDQTGPVVLAVGGEKASCQNFTERCKYVAEKYCVVTCKQFSDKYMIMECSGGGKNINATLCHTIIGNRDETKPSFQCAQNAKSSDFCSHFTNCCHDQLQSLCESDCQSGLKQHCSKDSDGNFGTDTNCEIVRFFFNGTDGHSSTQSSEKRTTSAATSKIQTTTSGGRSMTACWQNFVIFGFGLIIVTMSSA